MKIASPLSRIREVAPLAKAGADEFYCGVAPMDWRESFGFVESISRRNNPFAHLSSHDELEKAVGIAHKYGVSIHAALNESYNSKQIGLFLDQLSALEDAGVDAVILGDPAPLTIARKSGFKGKIFMGTGGTIFNSETVKFYKSFGVKRMILPRHLPVFEIKEIIKKVPDVEYEVFIFRGLCPFIDGFCRFQHGINETLKRKPGIDLACTLKFRIKTLRHHYKEEIAHIHSCPVGGDCIPDNPVGGNCIPDSGCDMFINPQTNKKIKRLMSPRQSLTGCGLCAIYDLARIKKPDGSPGVAALKIVGREFSSREKLENVKVVRSALNLLENNFNITREQFQKKCQDLFKEFFKKKCSFKDCYYPDFMTAANCDTG